MGCQADSCWLCCCRSTYYATTDCTSSLAQSQCQLLSNAQSTVHNADIRVCMSRRGGMGGIVPTRTQTAGQHQHLYSKASPASHQVRITDTCKTSKAGACKTLLICLSVLNHPTSHMMTCDDTKEYICTASTHHGRSKDLDRPHLEHICQAVLVVQRELLPEHSQSSVCFHCVLLRSLLSAVATSAALIPYRALLRTHTSP